MGLPRRQASAEKKEEPAPLPPPPFLDQYQLPPGYPPQAPPGMYPPGMYAPMMMPPPPPQEAPIPPADPYFGAAPVPMTAPLEQDPAIAAVNEAKQDVTERFKGPLSAKRSCTDILCILPFIFVFIGFIAVTLAGLFIGNPLMLFMGYNSEKQMCGAGPHRHEEQLFMFDPISCISETPNDYMAGCKKQSICVKECPNQVPSWNWVPFRSHTAEDVFNGPLKGLCLSTWQANETVEHNVKAGKCPPYVFPSKSYYFRCEPAFLTDENSNGTTYNESKFYQDAAGNYLTTDKAVANLNQAHHSLPFITDLVDDLAKTWPHILVFTGMTMVVSFLWIFFMRFFGPCLIWFTVLILVLGSMIASAFTWVVYDALNRNLEYALGVVPTKELATMPKDLWLVCGIFATLLALIFLVLFCALFNRIRLAAAVVTESSRAIAGSMLALVWPIVPFCLQIGVHALFVVGMIFFLTATSNGEQSLDFKTLNDNINNMWPVLLCLLFAWFWIINFILALNYVTLAGSFSSWYWNSGTPDSERLQLFAALWRALRYHIGTMAFGALIIAIVQTIRAVLRFFEAQFKKLKNPIGVILTKCLGCCMWCVEKVLKFITKNAYIMLAIEGRHFCSSARKAFKLIVENCVRIVVLDTISSVLIGISVFVIVAGFGVFALFVFYPSLAGWTLPPAVIPQVKYFWIPLIVEVIASLLAALCFFSVYKMAIDTIFLNIMYDLKYNDGTAEKPYRARKSLLSVVGKKNKKDKKAED